MRTGREGSARSGASGWREPGATGQRWPGTCEPQAIPWWRSSAPIAGPGACRARATRSTPRRRQGRCWLERPRGVPKTGDGRVEMIRSLRVARRSALKARTQATNQLLALVLTSPEELRASLRGLSVPSLVRAAARFRPGPLVSPAAATKLALRHLARRYAALSAEIAELDRGLAMVVAEAAPALLALRGVGTDVAGALLVAAGDNPERLSSEAAFARLCGVAPLPASSGKTNRHRLNRGGDRIANNALWRIVLVRMSGDPRTRNYVERRTKEGLSKKEIIRCLKRYVAREVYRRLVGLDEQ